MMKIYKCFTLIILISCLLFCSCRKDDVTDISIEEEPSEQLEYEPCAINSDSYGMVEIAIDSIQNYTELSWNIILNGSEAVRAYWRYYLDLQGRIQKLEYSYLDTVRNNRIFNYSNDLLIVDVYKNIVSDSTKDLTETYYINSDGDCYLKKTIEEYSGTISDSALFGWDNGNLISFREFYGFNNSGLPSVLIEKLFTYDSTLYAFNSFPEKVDVFGLNWLYFKPLNNVSQLSIVRYQVDSLGNQTQASNYIWNYEYQYSNQGKLESYSSSNNSSTYMNEIMYECNK